MPAQEKPSSLLTMQRELDALAELPDRLKVALASPTCLSSQLLTLLEQLQIAMNAIAISATVQEGTSDTYQPTRYSTLLDRELCVYSEMQFTQPVLRGSEGKPGFVNWEVASPLYPMAVMDCVTTVRKEIVDSKGAFDFGNLPTAKKNLFFARKSLSTARYLITIDWPQLTFGSASPEEAERSRRSDPRSIWNFKQLKVWINCDDADSQRSMFWRHAVESIRTAVELCLELTPIVSRSESDIEYENELIRFREQYDINFEASQAAIRRVFGDFKERLIWLLENHADLDQDALRSPFLAQFFWIGKRLTPSASETLTSVTPVFLSAQRELLEQQLLEDNPEADKARIDVLMSEFDKGAMDSRSLFSAFPADGRMSVYIERWNEETIQEGDVLPQGSTEQLFRKRFLEITSKIQEKYVKSLVLSPKDRSADPQKELILFSIPVLINEEAIFVVQINTRTPLSPKTRIALSDAVHALGGIVIYRIHFHMLKEFERTRKNAVVRAALLYQTKELDDKLVTSNLLVKDTVASPYKATSAVSRQADEFLQNKAVLLKDTLAELDERNKQLRAESRKRLLLNEHDLPAFNLSEAVEDAIAQIPMRLRHGLRITSRQYHDTNAVVSGFRPGFIVAVQNIIINAASAQLDRDAELRIESQIAYFDSADKTENDVSSLNQDRLIKLSFANPGPGFNYDPKICLANMSGLFQVKTELSDMGGELTIESKRDSLGVRVSFWLPITTTSP